MVDSQITATHQRYLLYYRSRLFLILISLIVEAIHQLSQYHSTLFPTPPTPWHTSVLSGEGWVLELINGHPERMFVNLNVHPTQFFHLVDFLQTHGYPHTQRSITVEEQLAIFLYTCVTGLSSRLVGERFQRSHSSIQKYFKKILETLSSPPFYTEFVRQPTRDTPLSSILQRPQFRFFQNCIGAVDGTHIHTHTPLEDHDNMRNRKGSLSQNCLFVCDFDFLFTYSLTGWDGSAADASIWHDARQHDLRILEGKYLLADAGFGSCNSLLVPYRGVRYHLQEWKRYGDIPRNAQELFNLRHASLRNIIERIFGVLKRQWRILQLPAEYSLRVQALIPTALCALHNFIRQTSDIPLDCEAEEVVYLLEEDTDFEAEWLEERNEGLLVGYVTIAEKREADARRDQIARLMWDDYLYVRRERGLPPP